MYAIAPAVRTGCRRATIPAVPAAAAAVRPTNRPIGGIALRKILSKVFRSTLVSAPPAAKSAIA
nr:hypothetical protein [uncultured bacterium]